MYELEYTKNPTAEDMKALTEGISENAKEIRGFALQVQTFGFFHKDSQSVVLAGCHGEICYRSMFISQLWVSKNLRHKGLGTLLVQKAEALAKDTDCNIIAINTMN